MPQEQKPQDPKVASLLDFIFDIAKDRPEWVGKYFKNVNKSFDIKTAELVDINSFNPDSRWLRGKDKMKFPRFILNKEIQDSKFFEKGAPEIFCGKMDIEFQEWLTKYKDSHFQDPPKRYEVYKYLINRFGATHHFPGIDYLKYLSESKKTIPANNPIYQFYLLPGCLFYDKDGILDLLSISSHGNEVRANFFDLDANWGTSNEVILFKK